MSFKPRSTGSTLATCVALAIAVAIAGCGSGSNASTSEHGAVLLRGPGTPSKRDCSVSSLRTNVSAQNLAPAPGSYSYKVKGTRSLSGGTKSAKRLPPVLSVIVTPSRRYGELVCFRVQRRYTTALGDTATFAVRGSDVYLTHLTLQSGGEITEIHPAPPVRSLAGNDLNWSGTFSGNTQGQFAGNVIGRRSLPLPGGGRDRAIGIQLRVSFAGQTRGTLDTTQWLSASRNFVLAEKVDLNRTFGLDHEHLHFQSHLQSLPGK
jgi:hypothetical protein